MVRRGPRGFDLDLEHCPNCGRKLKIIAVILERAVIEKLLTREACAPPRARQRVARR